MKRVSILALNDATMNCIDSAHQIISRVNDFLRYQQRPPYYDVEIVGLEKETSLNNGLYTIRVKQVISEINKTDVIIVPLTCGDFSATFEKNSGYADWLLNQYQNGAEIVCLCVGSFFVASTGLLDGRKCAVHWAARNEFETMFPKVQVIDDSIITDERSIYTCGGGFTYLNLLLYIIEKHLGRELSVLASKMFEIDIERKSQHPFAIFIGQKRHGDNEVFKVQEYLEQHPTASVSINDLCIKVNVGRRTLERLFKKCTGNSILEYVQRVKVEYVKKQLETSTKTVNEIVFEAGYTDADAFRRLFKKYTALSLIEYRKKYCSKRFTTPLNRKDYK